MPKPSGLFGSFDNLDLISIEAVASWLKPTPNLIQLENYLANKILYPQTLPLSEYEMKIDLSILREALKINGPKSVDKKTDSLLGYNPFLNITLRKIIIPKKFLGFIPNLVSLTWVFVDGLLLDRKKGDFFQDLWTVILTDDIDEVVGSVLLPQFEDKNSWMDLNILNENFKIDKNYKIRPGSLTVIPCRKDRCALSYKFNKGTILGKRESAVEVYGGRLGLMIDGRNA